MGIKEEFQKLGEDLFKGLRFGLGGPPSTCSTPDKKTRSKGKGRGKGPSPKGILNRSRDRKV